MNQSHSDNRGELTIFLGAAKGVGKTYAMIEAAQDRRREGVDVVAGWLNTSNPLDTEDLLTGLPVLDSELIKNGSNTLADIDVEKILHRAPQLVVIDELAHDNSAHALRAKRYLDVEKILAAGIDVYTTLNVQEIESLTDIVKQITGIVVTETVSDTFLERANRIQLIDIPPDELLQRFQDGKLNGKTSEDMLKAYYRVGNLIALRELALRYTAQRVDKQLEEYMRSHEISGPWPVAEKIMVCISQSPFSTQLIRVARQMANSLKAEWIAVYVETTRRFPTTETARNSIRRHLQLAEELGAEIVTLTGDSVAEEILSMAKRRNVKQIIIGKPRHSRLWEWLHESVVNEVIRKSHDISVHVLPGNMVSNHGTDSAVRRRTYTAWKPYFIVSLVVAGLTVILHGSGFSPDLVNIALLYLLPVLLGAVLWGLGTSFYAAGVGLLAFDFFFVPPFYSFGVADLRYIISFAVFLTVASLTASLASRLRKLMWNAKQREAVTSSLYALSRQMTAVTDLNAVLQSIAHQVSETIGSDAALFLPNDSGELQLVTHSNSASSWGRRESDIAIARWVFEHGEVAGRGSETLRECPDLYVPLRTEGQIHGVLAVNFETQTLSSASDRLRLIEALSSLGAVAISRIKLEEEAKVAHLMAESERLRSALLDSISHELRTPLAAIIGSVTGLLEGDDIFNTDDRRTLLSAIRDGALRMNRLVNNLLGMVRLESGMLRLQKHICDIEDIIGVALAEVRDYQQNRVIRVALEPGLPLVEVDEVLIEQVLVNVLSNSIKYSPDLSEIVISVRRNDDRLSISVADSGLGIAIDESERIFDKFYRSESTKHIPGTGLGLAICKGIIEAHRGTIQARPNENRGTVMTMNLPIAGEQADLQSDIERNLDKDEA